jgi:hypothetical protein
MVLLQLKRHKIKNKKSGLKMKYTEKNILKCFSLWEHEFCDTEEERQKIKNQIKKDSVQYTEEELKKQYKDLCSFWKKKAKEEDKQKNPEKYIKIKKEYQQIGENKLKKPLIVSLESDIKFQNMVKNAGLLTIFPYGQFNNFGTEKLNLCVQINTEEEFKIFKEIEYKNNLETINYLKNQNYTNTEIEKFIQKNKETHNKFLKQEINKSYLNKYDFLY